MICFWREVIWFGSHLRHVQGHNESENVAKKHTAHKNPSWNKEDNLLCKGILPSSELKVDLRSGRISADLLLPLPIGGVPYENTCVLSPLSGSPNCSWMVIMRKHTKFLSTDN